MLHGKWAVYPLTDAFMSVAQYLVRRMDEQDQLIFVKPNGYPIPEKSFAELENARENRVTLTEDVDMAIRTSAGLMIADGTIENSFRTKVLTKAKAALDQGKSVICALALTEDEVQQFRPYGEQFRYYTNAYQDLPQLFDPLWLRLLHPGRTAVGPVVRPPVVGAVYFVDGLQQILV